MRHEEVGCGERGGCPIQGEKKKKKNYGSKKGGNSTKVFSRKVMWARIGTGKREREKWKRGKGGGR